MAVEWQLFCSDLTAVLHNVVRTRSTAVVCLLAACVRICMPCSLAMQDVLRLSTALSQAEADKRSLQAQLRQAQGQALCAQETALDAAEQVMALPNMSWPPSLGLTFALH